MDRFIAIVVIGTFSRDTAAAQHSTARHSSPAGHWATRLDWCWQHYLQLSLEYCFGLLQPYKQQFNFHNHPSANSHITDFVKDKINSQFVEWRVTGWVFCNFLHNHNFHLCNNWTAVTAAPRDAAAALQWAVLGRAELAASCLCVSDGQNAKFPETNCA